MLLNGAFAGDDDDADDDLSEKVFLLPAEIQVLRAPLPPPHEIAGESEREADDSDDVFQLEGILARDITLNHPLGERWHLKEVCHVPAHGHARRARIRVIRRRPALNANVFFEATHVGSLIPQ